MTEKMKSLKSLPNILVIVTDQQRFDTIFCLGNRLISTPNLDRLRKRSMAFLNAYSLTPVCVPARYTMYSGLSSVKTGIYSNEVPSNTHDAVVRSYGPYIAEKMKNLGYRTFGIGKFHTTPWDAPLGFQVHLYSEEFYLTPEQRDGDDYAAWIARRFPEANWIEALMGERSEMYYMPQMSPLPADLTVESWATEEAIAQIKSPSRDPWFGFVSFVGPHPPFAPPLPFNRMYDPDKMVAPKISDKVVDFIDQQIPWMNHAVYAESVDPVRARVLKARYYGEITYIDSRVGRLLDVIKETGNEQNTLICFVSDHGDLLGDHNGWQKENYFEAATRIPFLVSWPEKIPDDSVNYSLVSLEDLFGLATSAAQDGEFRDGVDLLAVARGSREEERKYFVGVYGCPRTNRFKLMVRFEKYKLVWMANGGQSQIFDLANDPSECAPLDSREDLKGVLLNMAKDYLNRIGLERAFDGKDLWSCSYTTWEDIRIQQFDRSRGVTGYLY